MVLYFKNYDCLLRIYLFEIMLMRSLTSFYVHIHCIKTKNHTLMPCCRIQSNRSCVHCLREPYPLFCIAISICIKRFSFVDFSPCIAIKRVFYNCWSYPMFICSLKNYSCPIFRILAAHLNPFPNFIYLRCPCITLLARAV